MTAHTLPLFDADPMADAIARRDAAFPQCQGGPLACVQCTRFVPHKGYVATDELGHCDADGHATSAYATCTVPESFTVDTREWSERFPLYPEEYLSLTGAMWSRQAKATTGKVLAGALGGDEDAGALLSSAKGVNVGAAYDTQPDEAA